MRIGDLAAKAGVSVRSLRYYEEQGLLAATRTASGQRTYDAEAVDRVRLVQELEAARDRLDEVIHISEHPTPEHCPALRTDNARSAA
jgi:DNA-binding transcriptional MerR regulator